MHDCSLQMCKHSREEGVEFAHKGVEKTQGIKCMKLIHNTITSAAIATTAVLGISMEARAARFAAKVGLNFTGSTFTTDLPVPENQRLSRFRPPDTMGAVGDNHLVELINGRYAVYDKTTGVTAETSTLDTFWRDAGVNDFGNFTFDPRILYDPFSERWFAAAVDNAREANNFLVAVSNAADPTLGWTGFSLDTDSDNSHWADFPTLGFNAEGVFVSANMFTLTETNTVNTTILALPKADLIKGSVANLTLFENIDLNSTGFTVQPVVDLDNSRQPQPLLSDFVTSVGVFKRSTITGPIHSPTLDTTGGFIFDGLAPFDQPPLASQPNPGPDNIDSGDNRFSSNLILQEGSIWGVQSVNQNGRSALRWFEIDEATNMLLQEGLIADAELDFYYGSLAVNDWGQVVIGFSGSGDTQFISSYAAVGQTIDGATVFQDPLLLKAGMADYENLDGIGRNRWGDYSATVLDPDNPFSFWTFQEWASDQNQWSTQITQITLVKTPEPTHILGLLAFGALGTGSAIKRKSA